MSYVLDTSAVCALLEGNRLAVTRLDIAGKLAVSVPEPVWAELAYQLARLPRSDQKEVLAARCRILRDELRRAPWSDRVSEQFAFIKCGLEGRCARMDDRDVTVAAHALAAGAVLVTRHTERMALVEGLEVEDWGR